MNKWQQQQKLPCGRVLSEHEGGVKKKNIELWNERLSRYIQQQGLKNSDQRQKIIDIIVQVKGHFNVSALQKLVQESSPEIGAATVYRTINLLSEAGLIKTHQFDDNGLVMYEADFEEHHDHIVCLNCHHIFEFHSDKIEEEQKQILAERGFSEMRHKHVLYVRCSFFEKS